MKRIHLVLVAVAAVLAFPWPSAFHPYLPALALLTGIAVSSRLEISEQKFASSLGKTLLQVAVVMLGLTVKMAEVVKAGSSGFLFGLFSVTGVIALAILVGMRLKLGRNESLLIGAGTAICGGSAIAAVGSAVKAKTSEIALAAAVVFLLNAVALVLFPALGHLFGLTARQFGIWSGISIHDVASVVGAAQAYSAQSLESAVAVKMARVAFLIPVVMILARRVTLPWYLAGFAVAVIVRTWLPLTPEIVAVIKMVASVGFGLALFGIGTSVPASAIKTAGWRPVFLATLLWLTISIVSLGVIKMGLLA